MPISTIPKTTPQPLRPVEAAPRSVNPTPAPVNDALAINPRPKPDLKRSRDARALSTRDAGVRLTQRKLLNTDAERGLSIEKYQTRDGPQITRRRPPVPPAPKRTTPTPIEKGLNHARTSVFAGRWTSEALSLALNKAGKDPASAAFLKKVAKRLRKTGAVMDAAQGSRFMLGMLSNVQQHGLTRGLSLSHDQALKGRFGANMKRWAAVGSFVDLVLQKKSYEGLDNAFSKGPLGEVTKPGRTLGDLAWRVHKKVEFDLLPQGKRLLDRLQRWRPW